MRKGSAKPERRVLQGADCAHAICQMMERHRPTQVAMDWETRVAFSGFRIRSAERSDPLRRHPNGGGIEVTRYSKRFGTDSQRYFAQPKGNPLRKSATGDHREICEIRMLAA